MGVHNKGYLVATFLQGPTDPYERMDVSASAEWNKYNIHAFPLATWQNGIIQIQLATVIIKITSLINIPKKNMELIVEQL